MPRPACASTADGELVDPWGRRISSTKFPERTWKSIRRARPNHVDVRRSGDEIMVLSRRTAAPSLDKTRRTLAHELTCRAVAQRRRITYWVSFALFAPVAQPIRHMFPSPRQRGRNFCQYVARLEPLNQQAPATGFARCTTTQRDAYNRCPVSSGEKVRMRASLPLTANVSQNISTGCLQLISRFMGRARACRGVAQRS